MDGKKQTLTTGRETVEKIGGKSSDLEILRSIDFGKELEPQEKALKKLEKYLAQTISGLKQENESLQIRKMKPKDLVKRFSESRVEWADEERMAVAKLKEGLNANKVAAALGAFDEYWNPIIEKAEKLSRPKPSPTASLRHEVER